MGNKSSSSKKNKESSNSVKLRKKNRKANGDNRHDKGISCPDFGHATPYKFEEDVPVDITLYKSYGDLKKKSDFGLDASLYDIKIYRRSTASLPRCNSIMSGAQSMYSFASKTSQSSQNECLPPKAVIDDFEMSPRKKRASAKRKRVSMLSTLPEPEEFPKPDEVKKKLKSFEEHFRKSLVDQYAALEDKFHIFRVRIGLRPTLGDPDLSLLRYKKAADGAFRITTVANEKNKSAYLLTIPLALYEIVEHIRRFHGEDEDLWRCVALDIVQSVAAEVAVDLSRMFEYQIALLKESAAIPCLAEHAAACVVHYTANKNVPLDRNNAVIGVINARPSRLTTSSAMFSVLLDGKELKWDVYDIFKKPGLRKEIATPRTSCEEDEIFNDMDGKFFVAAYGCEPLTFGYRGQIIEWDWIHQCYKLNSEENKHYCHYKLYSEADIHQLYIPYKRVVGAEHMKQYIAHKTLEPHSSASWKQYLAQTEINWPENKDSFVVYRPISYEKVSLGIIRSAKFNDSDLIRMEFQQSDLMTIELKNCELLYGDFTHCTVDSAFFSGSDISYSVMVDSYWSTDTIGDVEARFVAWQGSQPFDRRSLDDDGSLLGNRTGKQVRVRQDIIHRKQIIEEERQIKITVKETQMDRLNVEPVKTMKRSRTLEKIKDEKEKSRRLSKLKRQRDLDTSNSSYASSTNPGVLDGTNGSTSPPPPVNDKKRPLSSVLPYRDLSIPNGHEDSFDTDGPIIPDEPQVVKARKADTLPATTREVRAIQTRSMVLEGEPHRRPPRSVSMYDTKAAFNSQSPEAREFQLDNITRGLDIKPIRTQLPQIHDPFIGRDQDVKDIANLIRGDSQFVLLTGSPGIGKTAVGVAVGYDILDDDFTVPIYIDVQGSVSANKVAWKIVRQFGLHFAYQEMGFFYRWLNSHRQKLLFIIDHIDAALAMDGDLAAMLSNLLMYVKDLSVLCICDTALHGDSLTYAHWQLRDMGPAAEEFLRRKIPTLHDDEIAKLADGCARSPLALNLVSNALECNSFDDSNMIKLILQRADEETILEKVEQNGLIFETAESRRELAKVIHCFNVVMEQIPSEERVLLPRLSKFHSGFGMKAATFCSRDTDLENGDIQPLLEMYRKLRLLVRGIKMDASFYYMPFLVKCVAEEYLDEDTDSQNFDVDYYLTRIKELTKMFHSKRAADAIACTIREYDNIVNMLSYIMQEEDRYSAYVSLLNPEISMYLHKGLEKEFYVNLYETLEKVAHDKKDFIIQSKAAVCLSNHFIHRGKYDIALEHAEKAYEIQTEEGNDKKIDDISRGFCLLCLGKAYWKNEETKDEGLMLVKKTVDLYKDLLGIKNPLTLYAYETYARLHIEKDSFQTARHFYNIIDFLVPDILGNHPLLLKGYDSRRAIWDRLLLFGRATESARSAVAVARTFYGDHPITAKMYNRLCECVIKRGSMQETLESAVATLSIRAKVLGDHIDTALSYKTLAYLMLRAGYYEKSLQYCYCASDMIQRLDMGSSPYATELRNITHQAKTMANQKSLVFVEIEPAKDSPRKSQKEDLNTTIDSIASTISSNYS